MNSRKLSGVILCVFTSIILVALLWADGSPMSIPRPLAQQTLAADGTPIPPLPPPKPPALSVLSADGNPGPPLPPPTPRPPSINFPS